MSISLASLIQPFIHYCLWIFSLFTPVTYYQILILKAYLRTGHASQITIVNVNWWHHRLTTLNNFPALPVVECKVMHGWTTVVYNPCCKISQSLLSPSLITKLIVIKLQLTNIVLRNPFHAWINRGMLQLPYIVPIHWVDREGSWFVFSWKIANKSTKWIV